MLVGLLYIFLTAHWLLPARLGVTEALEHPREYMTVVTVKSTSGNLGTSSEQINRAGTETIIGPVSNTKPKHESHSFILVNV